MPREQRHRLQENRNPVERVSNSKWRKTVLPVTPAKAGRIAEERIAR
jgi:hypothetical protein